MRVNTMLTRNRQILSHTYHCCIIIISHDCFLINNHNTAFYMFGAMLTIIIWVICASSLGFCSRSSTNCVTSQVYHPSVKILKTFEHSTVNRLRFHLPERAPIITRSSPTRYKPGTCWITRVSQLIVMHHL